MIFSMKPHILNLNAIVFVTEFISKPRLYIFDGTRVLHSLPTAYSYMYA